MSCAKTCACNQVMVNTKTGCVSSRVVEKVAWVMNKTNASGALNFIDLTQTLNDTYFQGLLNNTDPQARLFPLPECKNISDVRDKSVLESAKDGTMFKVRDGIRKFDGFFFPPFASPQLVAILQSERCASPCKFSVDANGTIWGRLSADGTKLYPMRMDAGSIDVIYTNPTDTEVEKVAYSYNLHPSERDCEVRGLLASDLVGNIDPLDYTGLMDVNMTVISASHTANTVVIQLYDNYGDIMPGMGEAVTGFLAANFALYNITTSTAITLTGVVEAPIGTYTLSFASGVSATNHLKVTPTKAGFDCSSIPSTVIIAT